MNNPLISPQKRLFLTFCLLFFLFLPKNALSQQHTISYEYDAAGNRISRTSEIILPKSAKMVMDTIGTFDEEKFAIEKNNEKYVSNNGFTIYPNPTTGRMVLEIEKLCENPKHATIKLINESGVCIVEIKGVRNYNVIDFYNFLPGVYILKYVDPDNEYSWKIIKL